MIQDTTSCAIYSMVTLVYIPVNNAPLTPSQISHSITEEGRHHNQKTFWDAHETFLSSRLQSQYAVVILLVHQIHPYFLEKSPLLCGRGEQIDTSSCVDLWLLCGVIFFLPGKETRFSMITYGSKKCFYYLFFPTAYCFLKIILQQHMNLTGRKNWKITYERLRKADSEPM